MIKENMKRALVWCRLAIVAAGLAAGLLVAGCAQLVTSAIVSAAPELLAVTLGQYNFRSEFSETVPLIKARDWLGLSTLARQKLEKEPNRGEWWQLAGYGHMQAGELTVARDCFLRVTQLLPEEVTGWNLYASTLTRLGDTRAARRALDKALQTDPTSTTAWVLLGDLDAAANRRVEAARAYERALDQDRGNIFAWYGIGLLAKRTNDAAALERAVKALRQLYPEFADELEKKA